MALDINGYNETFNAFVKFAEPLKRSSVARCNVADGDISSREITVARTDWRRSTVRRSRRTGSTRAPAERRLPSIQRTVRFGWRSTTISSGSTARREWRWSTASPTL